MTDWKDLPEIPILQPIETTCVELNMEFYDDIEDWDCPDCRGTGIGYNHEPNSCGTCSGRGYLMREVSD